MKRSFLVKIIVFCTFACLAQVSTNGCYLSGALSNGKSAGCGNGSTPCNLASSFAWFGAFCGSGTASGSGGQVLVKTQFILPSGCTATVSAEMKQRLNIHSTGCINSGADGNDYISITNNGGMIASEGSTICCSGTATCAAYPALPGSQVTANSASAFTTGCSNATIKAEMIVSGGTVTISGNSDRGDEITTYTINFSGACGASCGLVLPVTLVSFNARSESNNIILSWSSFYERNISYYSVQKSIDGHSFSEISRLTPLGETHNVRYQTTDHEPNKGINYYRIVTYDNNGTITESSVISLYFDLASSDIVVNNDGTNIHVFFSEPSEFLYVYDIAGSEIKKIECYYSPKVSFPASELGRGVFLFGTDKSRSLKKMLIY